MSSTAPGLRTRLRSIDPAVRDWWPVAGLLLLHQLPVGMTGAVTATSLVTVLFALAVSLPLRWRRTHALWVCAAIAAATTAQVVVTGPTLRFGAFVALLFASFSAGANEPLPRGAAGLLVLLGTVAGVSLFDPPVNPVEFVFPVVYLGGAWTVGLVVRRQRHVAVRMADLAESLRTEREERARLAVLAERSHIAREVHDIVAHSLGVVVVQAEAAAALLGDDSPAQRPLSIIQRTGRDALTELRGVLGTLRSGADDRSPQPTVVQLERLVQDVRAAGVDAAFDLSGDPADLPDGLQLAVFRIVQEALTNALKHGAGAPVRASVTVTPDEVQVRVVVATMPRESETAGYGLVGMRERVAMHGGRLSTGVRPGEGFAVEAWLPVPAGLT